MDLLVEYLSEIIAFLALLLSGYATYRSLKFKNSEKELVEVQKKLNLLMFEKEKREADQVSKADIGANFISTGKHNYRLKIFNKGKAPAYNVTIGFPDGNDMVDEYSIKRKLPLEKMEQGQSVDLLASYGSDSKMKLKVELKWQNKDGKEQTKIVYPTL